LADTFNTWFEPDVLRDARTVLEAAGFKVHLAQLPGKRKLCCGRTYLAAGMIEEARVEAQRMLDALSPWAKKGVPIVGLEPSCLLTLRDEYKVLLPGKITDVVAAQAMLLEEFLLKEHEAGNLDWTLTAPAPKALIHGHCHQKALNVFSTVEKSLALIPEMEVDVIESSCCGMAGAFGYAKDTADVSVKMAELDLLPAVRSANAQTLIVADGTSCRHQIAGGSEREAIHVAQVFALALNSQAETSLPSSEKVGPVPQYATGFNHSSGSNIGDVS
jgi:Fe-S oxidoreductase